MIPSLTIKFFQPSYLRRYSNLSSPYEVNLILPSFSVFISFQESLAIRLRSPISLETESQTKRKKKKLLLKSIFRRSRSGNKYHQGKGNNEFFLRFHEIEKFIIVRRTIIPRRIFSPLAFHDRLKEGRYIFFRCSLRRRRSFRVDETRRHPLHPRLAHQPAVGRGETRQHVCIRLYR